MAVRNLEAVEQLGRIDPINLDAKQTGERSAGNPHAAFDAAGAGNVAWSRCCDTRNRKGEATGNTNFDLNRRASPRPYLGAPGGETPPGDSTKTSGRARPLPGQGGRAGLPWERLIDLPAPQSHRAGYCDLFFRSAARLPLASSACSAEADCGGRFDIRDLAQVIDHAGPLPHPEAGALTPCCRPQATAFPMRPPRPAPASWPRSGSEAPSRSTPGSTGPTIRARPCATEPGWWRSRA
jgi:hypothetical protein